MQIISDFKDFYDYSPQQFGTQPDLRIIYNRNNLYQNKDGYYFKHKEIEEQNDPYIQASSKHHYINIHHFKIPELEQIQNINSHMSINQFKKWKSKTKIPENRFVIDVIFICGKLYPICFFINEKKSTRCNTIYFSGQFFNKNTIEKLNLITNVKKNRKMFEFTDLFTKNTDEVFYIETQHSFFESVKEPVFRIKVGHSHLWLLNKIPCLRDNNFDFILDQHQTYQNIEMYLSKIQKCVDINPPVEIGEKYKIEAAGFDLKTSFRHPVK